MRVTGDLIGRDALPRQQIIKQNARAGTPLPIDKAQTAQIRDRRDAFGVARRQHQTLLAMGECDQGYRFVAQILAHISLVVCRRGWIEQVAARQMRLAPPQRHQAAERTDIDRRQPPFGRAQPQMRRQQIQHGIVAAHDQQRALDLRQRTIEPRLEPAAAVDALVKARDMRQAVGLRQGADHARAALQRRRLQTPVNTRQRQTHKVIVADGRDDLARRDRLDDRARFKRLPQPAAYQRQYQQLARQGRADRIARHADDGDRVDHADDDRMPRTRPRCHAPAARQGR